MYKTIIMLIFFMSVLCCGLIISFYDSKLIVDNLQINDGIINNDESLLVLSELKSNNNGIYVIQINNNSDFDRIIARVFDPNGKEISTKKIIGSVVEEKFNINKDGVHKLLIENESNQEISVIGAIGYEPDRSVMQIGIITTYIMIIGIIISIIMHLILKKLIN